MKKWVVTYYKTSRTVSKKIVFASDASGALKKARVKYAIELKEIGLEG